MRLLLWCLMLPGFVSCSAENVVAGKEKTKSEQLADSVPAWCESVCHTFEQCAEDSDCGCADEVCTCAKADDDCVDDCRAEMARWADGTDKCATVGQRLQSCIDEAGCDVFDTEGLCRTTAAERKACPGDDPDDPPTGSPSGTAGTATATAGTSTGGTATEPPSWGGTTVGAGMGGTGNLGGSYVGGTGGGSPSGEPVTCDSGYTSGQAGSANSPVTCDSGQLACSDGNRYTWFCVTNSNDENICSCSVNGSVVKGFDWTRDCPDVVQINAICGWHLVSNL
jgi:hypothetical protein